MFKQWGSHGNAQKSCFTNGKLLERIANNPPLRFLSINTLYIFIQKNWGFLAILYNQSDITINIPKTDMEPDTNRPEEDYTSFDLSVPDPDACANACREEEKCMAYTYVKPGVQGENARCWLKTAIPDARPDECCISGVIRTP